MSKPADPSMPPGRPQVLLVDDDDGDIFLMRHAFGCAEVAVELHAVGDGEKCLAFLRKEGCYAGMPTPDLILLDLNMPLMGGCEALAALVADPQLCALPVVVFSTSASLSDIRKVYGLRASTYIVKPRAFEDLQHTIDVICRYWFTVAALPRSR